MMPAKVDVVVIGGGIVGLMTAWHLAEEGADVALVEAQDFGAGASGANAGSIHLQIQYPEFVAYGEDWARAYAPCLPFLAASLRLWQDLPERVGENLDVKLSGGLVVAHDQSQMRNIEAKARIEASVGVETVLLGREELREIAPYLSDKAIGAGFCAMEGKANPLRAIPAVAAAAKRVGARLMSGVEVTGLVRGADGFAVETTNGDIRAARVVNAAGAKAGRIARMLGVALDIDGFPLQVTVTEPVAPLIPHLVYSAAGKLTLKQVANGGIIIGGGWSSRVRPDGSLVIDPGNFARNMAVAVDAVPAMADIRVLRTWAAWVNGTSDWRPILGEMPGCPGFFLALFPWVGFSAAPMTARVTADLVLGREPRMPLKGISVLAD